MKDKAILFLSHLIPKELDDDVMRYSKNNMQDAANALQWHLLQGFSYNLNHQLDIINLMMVGSYPQYYKKPFIKEERFDCKTEEPGINVGFCNIKYIRRISIEKSLYAKVKKWCQDNKNHPRTIIVYSLHPIMLDVLAKIKEQEPSVNICAIVADLPNMMNLSSKTGIMQRVAQSKFSSDAFERLNIVDEFVFLTKYMSEYLHNDKPYCVMEGIATDYFENVEVDESVPSDIKIILYTGTLHRKFGVLHLVEAFSKISRKNYRLVICGAGDSEKEIKEAAVADSRIIYKGQCTRKDVLKMQKNATVLVNPRMNIEEFTKYSFPSKNMEYMSSGTPLVAYKLDGIPDEYDSYVTFVKDNTIDTLAETLVSVCESPVEVRKAMGKQAQDFVLENKNEVLQTRHILEMIEKRS